MMTLDKILSYDKMKVQLTFIMAFKLMDNERDFQDNNKENTEYSRKVLFSCEATRELLDDIVGKMGIDNEVGYLYDRYVEEVLSDDGGRNICVEKLIQYKML